MMAGGGHDRPGTVVIPWYATGFRGNVLQAAINEIAPVALRYGASSYAVYRSRDDRYRFQQMARFERHLDWERYWEGPEMTELRTRFSGAYQIPVLYGWWDLTVSGGVVEEPVGDGHGNGHDGGHGNGHGAGSDSGTPVVQTV
jgi:hypothetical protein